MKQKIINILSEVSGYDKKKFNEYTSFVDLGLNSIIIIQIMVRIEEEFSIEFEDDDLDFTKLNTLNDLINMVIKYLHINTK